MYGGFSQIFWGLLLVILDLSINRIDILPDFIGYIFVALGCGTLASASNRFNIASKLSWLLVILRIFLLFSEGRAPAAMRYTETALDCTMIWFLLGGIMDFSLSKHRADLAVSAARRRIAYVVLGIITTVFFPLFVDNSRDAAAILLIIVVATMFVLFVVILHLIHRVQIELTGH